MNILPRENLESLSLPGRAIQKAVGKDAASLSSKMTVGFARYSEENGPMEPHNHAEEVVYILDAKDGWVEFGGTPEALAEKVELKAGMTLHIPALEWHVFRYAKGGFVDIVFIYGQVDNIRPEEIQAQESA